MGRFILAIAAFALTYLILTENSAVGKFRISASASGGAGISGYSSAPTNVARGILGN